MTAVAQQRVAIWGPLLALVLAAACSFDTSTKAGGDGATTDGTIQPLIATPQDLVVIQDTPTPITLSAEAAENFDLTFAVTTTAQNGSLDGTPPDLTYTPASQFLGADSFDFEVTDSAGQVADATITITVRRPPPSIHEPFDYETGTIGTRPGSSELGLEGTWTEAATNPSIIFANSLGYGSVSTAGNHLFSPGGFNRFVGGRKITPESLAAAGLLDDGAELWFSALVGIGPGANVTNILLDFALATAPFGTANGNRFIQTLDAINGQGIGFSLHRGVPRAASFVSALDPTTDLAATGAYGVQEHGLVVGRIRWGTSPELPDTVELFRPNLDLSTLGPAVSTLEVIVEQAAFDTLTMNRNDRPVIDEIRFGPSYSSVL